jgi:hypothetical protein
MNNKKFKNYLNNFRFEEWEFENIPSTMLAEKQWSLSKEEESVLRGIKIALSFKKLNQKKDDIYLAGRVAGFSFVLFIGLIGLISMVLNVPGEFAKTVSAASAKADEIVQSTMSAILRR